jgi:3-oxoacyl-[acyl-carrier-protein] synthase-1
MTAPFITAAACTFPSGPSVELADAAVRAQLSLLQHHPYYRDRCGLPVRVSRFPIDIPDEVARWCTLATAVLNEILVKLPDGGTLVNTPCLLWLVLPDPALRPGIPIDLVERLTAAAQQVPLPWQRIEVVKGGHAAGAVALEQSVQALAAAPNAMAIVVGVESCFSSEAMMWLEYQFLLHGARQPHRGKSRVNPYGRVPGEGAAAIALTGRQQLDAPPAWASLLGVGLAEEPVTYDTPEPCIGMGLALAARRALEQAGKHTKALVGNITVDLNGEPYRADEFGFVALRLGKRLASDWQRHAPALVSGDLNSASAITHVALAAYAMHVRPQPAQHLVLASSDDPQRGAVLLGAAQPVPTPIEVRPWRSPSTSTA